MIHERCQWFAQVYLKSLYEQKHDARLLNPRLFFQPVEISFCSLTKVDKKENIPSYFQEICFSSVIGILTQTYNSF